MTDRNPLERTARVCDACGQGMNEGFLYEPNIETFCSETCRRSHYTDEEWEEAGEDNAFWTTWNPDEELTEHVVYVKAHRYGQVTVRGTDKEDAARRLMLMLDGETPETIEQVTERIEWQDIEEGDVTLWKRGG